MKKDEALMLVSYYRRRIDEMKSRTFYCEDDDGVLRRWYPPSRHSTDQETSE